LVSRGGHGRIGRYVEGMSVGYEVVVKETCIDGLCHTILTRAALTISMISLMKEDGNTAKATL
jgi:hypothetical protein